MTVKANLIYLAAQGLHLGKELEKKVTFNELNQFLYCLYSLEVSKSSEYEEIKQIDYKLDVNRGNFLMNIANISFLKDLNNVTVKPSKLHKNGCFATRDILPGEVLTLFPCDVLYTQLPSDKPVMGMILSKRLTEKYSSEGKEDQQFFDEFDHRFFIDGKHMILGHPDFDKTPNSLAHLINDAYTNVDNFDPLDYAESAINANCKLMVCSLGLSVCAVATKKIPKDTEVTAHYGYTHWDIYLDKIVEQMEDGKIFKLFQKKIKELKAKLNQNITFPILSDFVAYQYRMELAQHGEEDEYVNTHQGPDNVDMYRAHFLQNRYKLPYFSQLNRVKLVNGKCFTSRDITKGEIITFYPADVFFSGIEKQRMGMILSDRLKEKFKDRKPEHYQFIYGHQYKYRIDDTHFILGHPSYTEDNGLLAHLVKDPNENPKDEEKYNRGLSSVNCELVNSKSNLFVALIATKDIVVDTELFRAFGYEYWSTYK